MSAIHSFRDLDVWQSSMDLVDRVIEVTRQLPAFEFDLKRQIRRAAISVPSNIAEGWRRKRRRSAYQNHVSIAWGSESELETQLEVCVRNGLLEREACRELVEQCRRVSKMLEPLHDSLDS